MLSNMVKYQLFLCWIWVQHLKMWIITFFYANLRWMGLKTVLYPRSKATSVTDSKACTDRRPPFRSSSCWVLVWGPQGVYFGTNAIHNIYKWFTRISSWTPSPGETARGTGGCLQYPVRCMWESLSYADDTFALSNKNVEKLNNDLDRKYREIAQCMDMNKVLLNNYKSYLMVMTSTKKHANHLFLHTGGRKVTWCKGAFKYYISRVSQSWTPHPVSARSPVGFDVTLRQNWFVFIRCRTMPH